MSLSFFLDQCVPMSVHDHLVAHGHDAKVLANFLPIRSPDDVVIKKAQELGSILLSLNGDFSDIVHYPPEKFKGIVSLQLHNHPKAIPLLMRQLDEFVKLHPRQRDYHGKLLLVEAHRIRVRS